jgi:hypothetical protein
LEGLKKSLGSKAPVDWSGAFYQYANRLAYLDWLRREGVSAFLVSVYFTNAPDVPRSATAEQWQGAISLLHAYLGLGGHRLKPYTIDIFIDALTLVR